MFLKGEFSNRLVQVSLFSGIVYYITAYPVVFEKARKYFPVKFKKTHHLLIFHTFVFAVLMYLLTYFVFDPIVRVVEGSANEGAVVEDADNICNGIKCDDGKICQEGQCVISPLDGSSGSQQQAGSAGADRAAPAAEREAAPAGSAAAGSDATSG